MSDDGRNVQYRSKIITTSDRVQCFIDDNGNGCRGVVAEKITDTGTEKLKFLGWECSKCFEKVYELDDKGNPVKKDPSDPNSAYIEKTVTKIHMPGDKCEKKRKALLRFGKKLKNRWSDTDSIFQKIQVY